METPPTTPLFPNYNKERDGQILPSEFLGCLQDAGYDLFTGVPDSLFKDFLTYLDSNLPKDKHIISANEGTAVALAAGHFLATGKPALMYMQNSGLGNAVNPLTSLTHARVYNILVLVMIGWRGEPGTKDEPQHGVMGELTPKFLENMAIPFEVIPPNKEKCAEALVRAADHMKANSTPYCLLVQKGIWAKEPNKAPKRDNGYKLTREQVAKAVMEAVPAAALVTTTGMLSREVYTIREEAGQPQRDMLTVGSMGHCSSIALGTARGRPGKQVFALDGDGAAIMQMGSLVTNAIHGTANFKHIVINNDAHDSVGGQSTGAGGLDFGALATACGYKNVIKCEDYNDEKAVQEASRKLEQAEGPALLELRCCVQGQRPDLGRPKSTPMENGRAFMGFVQDQ
jgi:phosphonopyruvate decarboxylase